MRQHLRGLHVTWVHGVGPTRQHLGPPWAPRISPLESRRWLTAGPHTVATTTRPAGGSARTPMVTTGDHRRRGAAIREI